MKPYIEELIRDIKEAENKAKQETEETEQQNNNSLLNQLCQPKEHHFGNPRTIEEIVGIPRAAFPPEHLLTTEEKANLSEVMERLLKAWNFYPDFPPRVPMDMRYKTLRQIWKSKQVYVGMGVNYIDVCEFEESTCPFPDYCNMCEKIKEQEKLYNQLMENRSNNRNSDKNQ
jgi:hypothetical protein